MSLFSKNPRLFALLGAGAMLSGGFSFAQEKLKSTAISELPAKFDSWQDEMGFEWQLSKNGAILSGNTPYFQGGLTLFSGEKAFAATSGTRFEANDNNPVTRLSLQGSFENGIRVERRFVLDAERSGLQVIDSFSNDSGKSLTVDVVYKSSFQYPWQDVLGTGGRILRNSEGLAPRDFGVIAKYAEADGRHDSLFVTSGENGGLQPSISFSSNNRELLFTYKVGLKAGETKSILSLVAQRNLKSSSAAADALKGFYSKRQLVRPVIEKALAKSIVNFDPKSLPGDPTIAAALDSLIPLNELLQSKQLERGASDMMWISGDNQLTGTINRELSVIVTTPFGERKASAVEIAAIEGGSGIGRSPRVFLRNGEVLSGAVKVMNLSMAMNKGWTIDSIEIDDLVLLVFQIGESDGKPPKERALFVEFRDGNVVTVPETGEATPAVVRALTPWGKFEVPLSDLNEIWQTDPANPRFRLETVDGTQMTGFLNGRELRLTDEAQANWSEVKRVWRAGKARIKPDSGLSWFEFRDVESDLKEPVEGPVFLLSGNNILSGELEMEAIHLIADRSVTQVDPKEISEIRRALASGGLDTPVFEIELGSGNVLSGRIREKMMGIKGSGKSWKVPVHQFLSFRSEKGEGE